MSGSIAPQAEVDLCLRAPASALAHSVTSPVVIFHPYQLLAEKGEVKKTSSKYILQNLVQKNKSCSITDRKVPTWFFNFLLVAASCFCTCSATASSSLWGHGEGGTAGASSETTSGTEQQQAKPSCRQLDI